MSIEQKQALATIKIWWEQVLVVFPTGAGKGRLFMLPCIFPDGRLC